MSVIECFIETEKMLNIFNTDLEAEWKYFPFSFEVGVLGGLGRYWDILLSTGRIGFYFYLKSIDKK